MVTASKNIFHFTTTECAIIIRSSEESDYDETKAMQYTKLFLKALL